MHNKLKVISLNCYGAPISFNRKLRFGLIAKEINKLSPDIVMLQEAFYPGDIKCLEPILKLNGWQFYPPNYPRFNKGGLIVIAKKDLIISNYSFTQFKDQGPIRLLPLADRIAGKGFQTIQLRLDKKEIQLVNAHLVCMYNKKDIYLNAYKNQVSQLSEYLKTIKSSFILGGDLNDIPSSSVILKFKGEFNLNDFVSEDIYTVSHKNTNRKGWIKPFLKQQSFRTDYIFVTHDLKINKEQLIFDLPVKFGNKNIHISDHFGILAEILV